MNRRTVLVPAFITSELNVREEALDSSLRPQRFEDFPGQDRVKERLGKQGQWIYVQAPGGEIGYVAAWYVKMKTATQPAFRTP